MLYKGTCIVWIGPYGTPYGKIACFCLSWRDNGGKASSKSGVGVQSKRVMYEKVV